MATRPRLRWASSYEYTYERHLQRTRWTASLQIGCLLAADIPNVILGILNHMFLGDDAVKAYQNQVKPESK